MRSYRSISCSTKVKCDDVTGLRIYGFLLVVNSNLGPTPHHYEIEGFEMSVTLNLTFEGYSRSNVMVQLDSPYMSSY